VTVNRAAPPVNFTENFTDATHLNDWEFAYNLDASTGNPVTEPINTIWFFNHPTYPGTCFNNRGQERMSSIIYKNGTDWVNYTYQVNMRISNERDHGIVFRADANNFYAVVLANNGPGSFSFKKVINGVMSTIPGTSPVLLTSLGLVANTAPSVVEQTVTLKIEVNGSDFKFYVNGILAQEFTDSSLTRGSVGFYADRANVRFSNLSVIG